MPDHAESVDGLFAERPLVRTDPLALTLLRLERDPENLTISRDGGTWLVEPDPKWYAWQRLEWWARLAGIRAPFSESKLLAWWESQRGECDRLERWAGWLRRWDRAGYDGPKQLPEPVYYATNAALLAVMAERANAGLQLRHPCDTRVTDLDEHAEIEAAHDRTAKRVRERTGESEPDQEPVSLYDEVLGLLAQQRRPLEVRLGDIDEAERKRAAREAAKRDAAVLQFPITEAGGEDGHARAA